MSVSNIAVAIFALLLIAAPAKTEEPAITLKLTPQVGFAPLTVYATIRIQPNWLNRAIRLEWESDRIHASALWSVEGQYAPTAHYYVLKQLSADDYKVQATIIRVMDSTTTLAQSIRVLDTIGP